MPIQLIQIESMKWNTIALRNYAVSLSYIASDTTSYGLEAYWGLESTVTPTIISEM